MEHIKLDWDNWDLEEEDNKEKKILLGYKNNDIKSKSMNRGTVIYICPVSIVRPSLKPLNLIEI